MREGWGGQATVPPRHQAESGDEECARWTKSGESYLPALGLVSRAQAPQVVLAHLNSVSRNATDWSRSHNVVWRCTYHVVWVPKYRRKVLVDGVDVRLKSIILESEAR